MRLRTQTTRTNHLGYDLGASRKIPDGALARVTTAECLEANKSNALTRFALTLFRLLCFGFGAVKAALKAVADAITTPKPKQRRWKSVRANRVNTLNLLALRHSAVATRVRAPSGILREAPTS